VGYGIEFRFFLGLKRQGDGHGLSLSLLCMQPIRARASEQKVTSPERRRVARPSSSGLTLSSEALASEISLWTSSISNIVLPARIKIPFHFLIPRRLFFFLKPAGEFPPVYIRSDA
jgi:hypothetical protein